MSDAPERIWATPFDAALDGGTYCNAEYRPTAPNYDAWCYIRADLRPTPTLADALAVPEVAALVKTMTRIRNYCAHGPISQGEVNCAAWANAALDRIKGA
jgi:hypothetical protein